MRLVLDGLAFQEGFPAASAPLGLWAPLIAAIDAIEGVDLILLDRGNAPRLDRGRALPFPPQTRCNDARDSILLQKMCDHLAADVFISTGSSTPLRTPSLMLWSSPSAGADVYQEDEQALALAFARGICMPLRADPEPFSGKPIVVDPGIPFEVAIEKELPVALVAPNDAERHAEVQTNVERLGLPVTLVDEMALSAGLDACAAAGIQTLILPAEAVEVSGSLAEAYGRGFRILTGLDRRGDPPGTLHLRSVDTLASCLTAMAADAADHARTGVHDRFFDEWERLRRLQADVDTR